MTFISYLTLSRIALKADSNTILEIGYITVLDIYLIVSQIFVVSSIVEFCAIHYWCQQKGLFNNTTAHEKESGETISSQKHGNRNAIERKRIDAEEDLEIRANIARKNRKKEVKNNGSGTLS